MSVQFCVEPFKHTGLSKTCMEDSPNVSLWMRPYIRLNLSRHWSASVWREVSVLIYPQVSPDERWPCRPCSCDLRGSLHSACVADESQATTGTTQHTHVSAALFTHIQCFWGSDHKLSALNTGVNEVWIMIVGFVGICIKTPLFLQSSKRSLFCISV